MFEIRIKDDRINAFRVIKGQTKYDVESKAAAQIEIWNEKAQRKLEKAKSDLKRATKDLGDWEASRQAELLSEEVAASIEALEGLLVSLISQPIPKWREFKDHFQFPDAPPKLSELSLIPEVPSRDDYPLSLSFLDKLISSRRKLKEATAAAEFEEAIQRWRETSVSIERSNQLIQDRFSEEKIAWKWRHDEFAANQKSNNSAIDAWERAYSEGALDAVEFLVNEALLRTSLPDGFPQGCEVSFNATDHTLIVDFELPNQDVLPGYREAKYVRTKSQITYKPVSESWKKATYDSILYQAALGLTSRIFTADDKTWIHSVVFNGWVQSIDKSTGATVHGCILSLQAGRDEFMPLDLSRVEPKACFRSLKGVASSRLSELTPIRPIQKLIKEDPRFVAGYAVVDGLDERTNLAAMDWQDFENLIREIFEKEFARNGGEVKITQASRDGGVDAVAFDPDPIRGGKIVIQAKRYVNTVGVSAVRDLYGTLQHEGAMKGILVTTATYGPDAYEFAKDKPITLISGGELLTILDRHGHSAKIDLSEARALRV